MAVKDPTTPDGNGGLYVTLAILIAVCVIMSGALVIDLPTSNSSTSQLASGR
jgi:hypothetical protein